MQVNVGICVCVCVCAWSVIGRREGEARCVCPSVCLGRSVLCGSGVCVVGIEEVSAGSQYLSV